MKRDKTQAGCYFFGFLGVLIVIASLATEARSQVIPTYSIGSIPAETVYSGQQLKFFVQGPKPGMPLSVVLTPVPVGVASLDPTSGLFTYVPSVQDHFEFTATFAAAANTQDAVVQMIRIKPSPQLAPEYDLIQYKRPLPDETTGNYINYTEVYAATPTPWFNGTQNVTTRQIEISGRTIVLDSQLDTANLLKRINSPNNNISKLTIYAETLIIRSSINLPQTNVVIFARELTFQNPSVQPGTAYLDTTPLDYQAPAKSAGSSDSKGADGLPGFKGGDITLHIGHFTSIPQTVSVPDPFGGPDIVFDVIRFVLKGGKGQGAGNGIDGQQGKSFPTFASVNPGSVTSSNGNTTCTLRTTLTLPAGTVYIQATCVDKVWPIGGAAACPGNGIAPKPPGIPGTGGNGGILQTSLDVGFGVEYGGSGGDPGQNVLGGPGGTPTVGIWYEVFGGVIKTCPATVSYPFLFAPFSSNGSSGDQTVVTESLYSWLSPYSLRMIIQWAKDAYRDGNLKDAQAVFSDYLPIVTALASTPAGSSFIAFRLEIEQYLHRLDANLDYYGNPAGWVPLLSLENNMQLLNQEVTAAVPLIYLAERIDKIASDEAKRQQTLLDTTAKLQNEVKAAAADFAAVETTVQQLSFTADTLALEVDQAQAEISTTEAALLARAQANVVDRHKVPAWLEGLRVLSAACEVLPIFQPVLGTVGEGLNLITNIDTSQPLQTLQQGFDIAKKFNDASFKQSQKQLDDMLNALNPGDAGSVANYVKNAAPVFANLADKVKQFRGAIQDKGVPQNEVDAEFAKLEAQDPVYHDLIVKITDLNAQKTSNARAMSKALDQLVKDTDTINADVSSIQDFQRAYSQSVGHVDQSTLVYMRDLEQRQLDRLQKYLYYMAKAYEYRLVKPYTGNLRLDSVVQKLRDMLKANGNVLTQADIDSIISVYQDSLRAVIAAGIDELQKKPPERSIQLRFGLTTDQLDTLNSTGVVTVNLKDVIPGLPNEENRRIADLGVLDPANNGIAVDSNANLSTGNLRIVIEHFGQSTLTSGGHQYLFRFGSPGFEMPFSWGASYDLVDHSFSPETLSLSGLSLLDAFLNTPAYTSFRPTLSQFVEPSAEALITIRKFVTPTNVNAKITRLRMFAQVDFYRGDSTQTTLDVLAPPVGEPYVAVTQPDLTGRTDGVGTFRRYYTVGTTVNMNAEPTYGGNAFLKWIDQNSTTISTNRSLSVSLFSARLVQPVYAVSDSSCSFNVAPSGINGVVAAGSSGTITITALAGSENCTWSVTDNPGWIGITSAFSGVGSGMVSYTIGGNSGIPRVGSLVLGNRLVTVNQLGVLAVLRQRKGQVTSQ